MATDLITKLEEAGEGSRELDALVTVALKLDCKPNLPDDLQYLKAIRRDDYCAPGTYWFVQRSGMSLRMSDPVTTSLDAALALAERVIKIRGPIYMNIMGSAQVVILAADPCADALAEVTASTPALALCAAILRASEEKQS